MALYEILLNKSEREKFMLVAKIKMIEKGWSAKDLAEEIDRPVSSVYNFFSNKKRINRFLAAEIADALDMVQSEWRV